MRKVWDRKKLKIKQAMKEVSNNDLAKKLGVGHAEVSAWRRGIEPPPETIPKLAKILACRADDFFVEVPE